MKLESDEPAEYGEVGRIVITDLHNYACPIIRYDCGDTCMLLPPNEQSNGYPIIGKLYGRRFDLTYSTDGKAISPLAYGRTLKNYDNISLWQFVQEGEKDYVLKLKIAKGDVSQFSELVKNFSEILGEGANLKIEEVDEIPVLSSGKRKPVVNNWKINFMKKLLVLGCAFGSDNLILEAKKMGLYVINADYYETTPAKQLSDESWLIDLRDIDALEAKCREENVEAIACGCQGFVITTSIELCNRLNLPIYCSDPRGYNLSRNKSVFKDHCEAIGAPTAKRYYLSDDLTPEELAKIEYPVVVKPVDKGGNTGISFCDNEEQLRAAYALARSVSDNPTIVCERKLHGPEWVANYVLANGEAKLLYLGREYHQPGEGANLYSMIVNSPFRLKQYMEEVNDKV